MDVVDAIDAEDVTDGVDAVDGIDGVDSIDGVLVSTGTKFSRNCHPKYLFLGSTKVFAMFFVIQGAPAPESNSASRRTSLFL